jgi:hypothetical protein
MTNDRLVRRLDALQKRMNDERAPGAPAGDGLQIVVMTGLLPPGLPLFAMAGELEWLRGPDEDLDLFANRAAHGAAQAGQRLLVIGGFPMTQAQQDASQATYDAWLLTDDGVPPMETSRGAPVSAVESRMPVEDA